MSVPLSIYDPNATKPKKDKEDKKNRKTLILIFIALLIILLGLGIRFYPVGANWWNGIHQSVVITSHAATVDMLTAEQKAELLRAARKYNAYIVDSPHAFSPTEGEHELYMSLLDYTDDHVMGVIGIPKIGVELPIYHGTAETEIQRGAGHLEGTSLPIGGRDTHAVITSHRGLPSAELFSRLDELVVGDEFTITVLDEEHKYTITSIKTVLPEEAFDEFRIEEGKDLCTLMTCTPYGVNSHRLLLRAERIDA